MGVLHLSSPEVNRHEGIPEENETTGSDKDKRIAILQVEPEKEKQKCTAIQIQLKSERFAVTRFSRGNKLIDILPQQTQHFSLSKECIERQQRKCKVCTIRHVILLFYLVERDV